MEFDLESLSHGIPLKIIPKAKFLEFIRQTKSEDLIHLVEKIESKSKFDEIAIVRDPLYSFQSAYYLAMKEKDILAMKQVLLNYN